MKTVCKKCKGLGVTADPANKNSTLRCAACGGTGLARQKATEEKKGGK